MVRLTGSPEGWLRLLPCILSLISLGVPSCLCSHGDGESLCSPREAIIADGCSERTEEEGVRKSGSGFSAAQWVLKLDLMHVEIMSLAAGGVNNLILNVCRVAFCYFCNTGYLILGLE